MDHLLSKMTQRAATRLIASLLLLPKSSFQQFVDLDKDDVVIDEQNLMSQNSNNHHGDFQFELPQWIFILVIVFCCMAACICCTCCIYSILKKRPHNFFSYKSDSKKYKELQPPIELNMIKLEPKTKKGDSGDIEILQLY